MRKAFLALSLLLAAVGSIDGCSSNKSSSGGPTACPLSPCPAMDQCIHTQCGSELQACNTPCSALLSCQAKCGCSDYTCRQKCTPSADCQTCAQTVDTCIQNKCSTVSCPDAGGGGGAGGAPGMDSGTD